MQMVGKNHVAPNRYAKINLCSLCKFDEGSVYIIVRQVRPTPIGATGYEISGLRGKTMLSRRGARGNFVTAIVWLARHVM